MNHKEAPHTFVASIKLRLFEQRATNEFIPADKEETIIISIPCKNFDDSINKREKILEEITKCIKMI